MYMDSQEDVFYQKVYKTWQRQHDAFMCALQDGRLWDAIRYADVALMSAEHLASLSNDPKGWEAHIEVCDLFRRHVINQYVSAQDVLQYPAQN